MVFSSGRRFFFALSAAGQAWGPPVRYDTCLDPSRAPWRCSEHSTSLNWIFISRGCNSASLRRAGAGKSHIFLTSLHSPLLPHVFVLARLCRPLYRIVSPIVFTSSAVPRSEWIGWTVTGPSLASGCFLMAGGFVSE